MSQEDNIRLANQLLAGIGQGADVGFEIAGDVGALPWIGRKTGRAAVAGFIRDQRDLTESLRFDVHGITADSDHAVIFGELASRIRATDKIIETAFALVLNISGAQCASRCWRTALRFPAQRSWNRPKSCPLESTPHDAHEEPCSA